MKETIESGVRNNKVNGIIMIILGLIMLLWPGAAMKIVCIVIGVVLIAMGGIRLLTYFNGRKRGIENQSDLTIGIIEVIVGIALIIISGFFISVFFILAGMAMLYLCYRMFRQAYELRQIRGSAFFMSLGVGIIVLVLGILMIINPVGTATFIVQLAGVAMIIAGLAMLFSRSSEA